MAYDLVGYVCTHDTDAPQIQAQVMVGVLQAWAQDRGVVFAAIYHDYLGLQGAPQPGWAALWTHCGIGNVEQVVVLGPSWVRWPRYRYRRLARRGLRITHVWDEAQGHGE